MSNEPNAWARDAITWAIFKHRVKTIWLPNAARMSAVALIGFALGFVAGAMI